MTPPSSTSSGDRTVHARFVGVNGVTEIVRYNRAGKWYIEPSWGGRTHVTLGKAAAHAVQWSFEIFRGRPGGAAFDRAVGGDR